MIYNNLTFITDMSKFNACKSFKTQSKNIFGFYYSLCTYILKEQDLYREPRQAINLHAEKWQGRENPPARDPGHLVYVDTGFTTLSGSHIISQ
jgi:hypothetical protein